MKINERIYYKYKRMVALIHKYTYDKMYEKLDDNQKMAYKIIKELISDRKTNLRIAPISGGLYLERDKIFIKIGYKEIKIVDDKYLYDVFLPDQAIEELRNHFNKSAEYKRIRMEQNIMKNIKVSLQLIHDNLKKEQKNN